MAANIWKNSLKNVESDNNKMLYETLLDIFFLQRNVTYFLNKPRSCLHKVIPIDLRLYFYTYNIFIHFKHSTPSGFYVFVCCVGYEITPEIQL